jgi:hypothetical protein
MFHYTSLTLTKRETKVVMGLCTGYIANHDHDYDLMMTGKQKHVYHRISIDFLVISVHGGLQIIVPYYF